MTSKTFPCLMLENKNANQNDYDKVLDTFSIITDQEHLEKQKRFYMEPVISTDPELLRKAKKIEKLFKPLLTT